MIEVIVRKLSYVTAELQSKRGELAEVEKAGLRAKIDGYHEPAPNVTAQRQNAEIASSSYEIDALDLRADIRSLEDWRNFYTLLITQSIPYDVSLCYPQNG